MLGSGKGTLIRHFYRSLSLADLSCDCAYVSVHNHRSFFFFFFFFFFFCFQYFFVPYGKFGSTYLTQSARIKWDPGWFCTILSRLSVKEFNRVWKWETGSGPIASCQNRTRCVWPKPDLAIRVGFTQYDPCLLWKNGCGKSGPVYTIMAITGRNQNASW